MNNKNRILKYCPNCNRMLPLSAFDLNHNSWDAHDTRCSSCKENVMLEYLPAEKPPTAGARTRSDHRFLDDSRVRCRNCPFFQVENEELQLAVCGLNHHEVHGSFRCPYMEGDVTLDSSHLRIILSQYKYRNMKRLSNALQPELLLQNLAIDELLQYLNRGL